MKQILILVGPAGSGKSTLSQDYVNEGYVRINQDDQGSKHLELFNRAVEEGKNIVVDRMNFNKEQRKRYIPHPSKGYRVTCTLIVKSEEHCLADMLKRKDHPTILTESNAKSALNTFFSKFEYPTVDEGIEEISKIFFRHPQYDGDDCMIVDIDGTVANIDHRLHFLEKTTEHKPNWTKFLSACDQDAPKRDVIDIVKFIRKNQNVDTIFCSGRGDEYRDKTKKWLDENGLKYHYEGLFMRRRADYRQDNLIKEIILDFEILTRYRSVFVAIDDRDQVVQMWRKRGLLCLQVANGDF